MGKRAKGVPWSILGSHVCVGQRAWLQPVGCVLMECQCPILEDKAGPRPSQDIWETGLRGEQVAG